MALECLSCISIRCVLVKDLGLDLRAFCLELDDGFRRSLGIEYRPLPGLHLVVSLQRAFRALGLFVADGVMDGYASDGLSCLEGIVAADSHLPLSTGPVD